MPDSLLWLNDLDGGAKWLSQLPSLIEAAADRFNLLELGVPYSRANVSYVLPARQESRDVILKIQFPSPECLHEADALELWNGNGAIMLLDYDSELHALILEPCVPGTPLAAKADQDKIGVILGLLRKLMVPAGPPFRTLEAEVCDWILDLKQKRERLRNDSKIRLVDAALVGFEDLLQNAPPPILLHQDLHGGNILAAQRTPWLAIDPKPLVGDPAFALSPVVRSFELGHSRQQTLYRLDRLSEELGIDRDRARLWSIGQTAAWSLEGKWSRWHLEIADWLLDG